MLGLDLEVSAWHVIHNMVILSISRLLLSHLKKGTVLWIWISYSKLAELEVKSKILDSTLSPTSSVTLHNHIPLTGFIFPGKDEHKELGFRLNSDKLQLDLWSQEGRILRSISYVCHRSGKSV